jgi:hypothetical protein
MGRTPLRALNSRVSCQSLAVAEADGIDAGDLVSGHAGLLDAGPMSFFDQGVAVTDAAGFYLDANLAAAGLRGGALDNFEVSTCLADLNDFHGSHRWGEGFSGFKVSRLNCGL